MVCQLFSVQNLEYLDVISIETLQKVTDEPLFWKKNFIYSKFARSPGFLTWQESKYRANQGRNFFMFGQVQVLFI